MPKTIAVIGALDTKGSDVAFVANEIAARGHRALLVDTSVMGEHAFKPHVSAAEVARAGGVGLRILRERGDKALAMEVMTRGAAKVVKRLFDKGKIDGVLALGGGAGTAIGTAAMRALPLGFPKLMVSTVASGDTSAYVGTKDIVMMPSIVDVAGINRISAPIYANAVGAIVGMVETKRPRVKSRPLLAASMFGNTTPVVTRCVAAMAERGYETLVFHATGTGGRTMESLVDEGFIDGVLDITTTEWADEVCGGVFTAGPHTLLRPRPRRAPRAAARPVDLGGDGPSRPQPVRRPLLCRGGPGHRHRCAPSAADSRLEYRPPQGLLPLRLPRGPAAGMCRAGEGPGACGCRSCSWQTYHVHGPEPSPAPLP